MTVDENHSCQDEDECSAFREDGSEICPNGQCVNRNPGYICLCNPGFIPTQDQKSCLDARQGHCYTSYQGNRCRNEMNFMLSRVDCCCGQFFGIAWGESRFDCQKCPDRRSREHQALCDPFSNIIKNNTDNTGGGGGNNNGSGRNKCSLDPNFCNNGKCVQTSDGSYQCECKDGYKRQGDRCQDVDECREGFCKNGRCRNRVGSFDCQCNPGFHLSRDGKECIDYNECEQTGMCANGICQNMDGSFRCDCNDGYTLSPSGLACIDVDECMENPLICLHGRCRNTPGSYICECEPGFVHSADGAFCMDENECAGAHGNVCGDNGRCVNVEGGYQCVCDPGFTDDRKTCVDIDECLSNPCQSGTCRNTRGGFECDCPQGFTLGPDGRTCSDTVKGLCYSMFRQGQCLNPSNNMVSKSTCCCGAAPSLQPLGWGMPCQVNFKLNKSKVNLKIDVTF